MLTNMIKFIVKTLFAIDSLLNLLFLVTKYSSNIIYKSTLSNDFPSIYSMLHLPSDNPITMHVCHCTCFDEASFLRLRWQVNTSKHISLNQYHQKQLVCDI